MCFIHFAKEDIKYTFGKSAIKPQVIPSMFMSNDNDDDTNNTGKFHRV